MCIYVLVCGLHAYKVHHEEKNASNYMPPDFIQLLLVFIIPSELLLLPRSLWNVTTELLLFNANDMMTKIFCAR